MKQIRREVGRVVLEPGSTACRPELPCVLCCANVTSDPACAAQAQVFFLHTLH
jgi:hypothetical protein